MVHYEHMALCLFTPVSCCEDTILLLQKDLDHHINNECPNRDCECEYCGEKGKYANITQVNYVVRTYVMRKYFPVLMKAALKP